MLLLFHRHEIFLYWRHFAGHVFVSQEIVFQALNNNIRKIRQIFVSAVNYVIQKTAMNLSPASLPSIIPDGFT